MWPRREQLNPVSEPLTYVIYFKSLKVKQNLKIKQIIAAKLELDAPASHRQPVHPNIPFQRSGPPQNHLCPDHHVQLANNVLFIGHFDRFRAHVRPAVPGNVVRRNQVLRYQATG